MTRETFLKNLPSPEIMKMRLRTFAMLDAIVATSTRSFEFHPRWRRGEQMGAFKDGSGNFFFVWFSAKGAVIRGFDHDSPMSPFRKKPPAPWPGLFEGLPRSLSYALGEEAFALEEVTFCFWHQGRRWVPGAAELPRGKDVDGAESLLACFSLNFSRWAARYYGEPLDKAALTRVWWGKEPIDGAVAAALNPSFDAREIRQEAALLGYKVGDLSGDEGAKAAKAAPPPKPSPKPRARSFGEAEFTVRCEPNRVRMLIHGKEVVAQTKHDVYLELFELVKARIKAKPDGTTLRRRSGLALKDRS